MSLSRIPVLVLALSVSQIPWASDDKGRPPKMSKETRMQVIRSLNAELVYVRKFFPMGKEGLRLKDGAVTPSDSQIQQLIANWGPAAKPGDRVRITNVEIKSDHIRFEINGGPVKKKKWYERIQISGMGGSASVSDPTSDPSANPRGSYVRLEFDKYVPELTGDQIRQLLEPVFNFKAKSAAEAFMDTVPPKLREAIKEHRVLVGMNREMVGYAKGRPPRKHRERDGEVEYEEWIYGQPPQDVEFVRFVGDEVVRVTTMTVDGQKLVRTEKEIDLKDELAKTGEPPPPPPASTKAPTLRRPGEPVPETQGKPEAPYPLPRDPDKPYPESQPSDPDIGQSPTSPN
jgi:hypothetical protein